MALTECFGQVPKLKDPGSFTIPGMMHVVHMLLMHDFGWEDRKGAPIKCGASGNISYPNSNDSRIKICVPKFNI